MESTQYPKVVFEALLDQIEVLQTEKRRLLFGDNADLLDDLGEEGDEEGGHDVCACMCLKMCLCWCVCNILFLISIAV